MLGMAPTVLGSTRSTNPHAYGRPELQKEICDFLIPKIKYRNAQDNLFIVPATVTDSDDLLEVLRYTRKQCRITPESCRMRNLLGFRCAIKLGCVILLGFRCAINLGCAILLGFCCAIKLGCVILLGVSVRNQTRIRDPARI